MLKMYIRCRYNYSYPGESRFYSSSILYLIDLSQSSPFKVLFDGELRLALHFTSIDTDLDGPLSRLRLPSLFQLVPVRNGV
jgi:hypothetical protein